MAKRKKHPTPEDWKSDSPYSSRSGGNLKDKEFQPFLERYPEAFKHGGKRPIRVRYSTYAGVAPGAFHIHVDIRECENMVWDYEGGCWAKPWDYKSKDHLIVDDKFDTREEAERFVRCVFRKYADPKHNYIVEGGMIDERIFTPKDIDLSKKEAWPKKATCDTLGIYPVYIRRGTEHIGKECVPTKAQIAKTKRAQAKQQRFEDRMDKKRKQRAEERADPVKATKSFMDIVRKEVRKKNPPVKRRK